jgi:hypothetical protein
MAPLLFNQSSPIILKDKKDVVKVVLYTQMLLKGIVPFENDLDILFELFDFGGYHNNEQKKAFYTLVINKKLRKTSDSINNKLTELAEKGILERYRKNCIRFNEEFLPNLKEPFEQVGFVAKITHAVGK